jgi:hypothetical protein
MRRRASKWRARDETRDKARTNRGRRDSLGKRERRQALTNDRAVRSEFMVSLSSTSARADGPGAGPRVRSGDKSGANRRRRDSRGRERRWSAAGLTAAVVAARPVAAAAHRPTIRALNRRARNVAVGAEDAAIPSLGLQNRSAGLAVIEELTSVGRHRLQRAMAAVRTRKGGFQDGRRLRHRRIPSKTALRRSVNPSPPP